MLIRMLLLAGVLSSPLSSWAESAGTAVKVID